MYCLSFDFFVGCSKVFSNRSISPREEESVNMDGHQMTNEEIRIKLDNWRK